MKKNIFYLCWDIHRLFGYENEKRDLVIDSIIKGIEAGDDFPPVSVHRDPEDPFTFYLSDTIKSSDIFTDLSDGGHYRALGHYIAGKPLKCKLLKSEVDKSNKKFIEIPNIIIVKDINEYSWRKQRFPDYR